MSLTAAVCCGIAVIFLLVAERLRSRAGVWTAKPTASLAFIAVAALGSGSAGSYPTLVIVALCACALGDVLLIPPGGGLVFLAGLGAFALGHVLYACAFWIREPQLGVAAATATVMCVVAWFTLRWLDPHLDRALFWAVRGYIAIIAVMVALAVGASVATGEVRIALGAVAFAISDLSVARDRFVRAEFSNLVWGLPMYYAAQVVLAWTVAS